MFSIRITVVSAETISTTNMTGLRASVRGLSLRRDSQAALSRISEEMPATGRRRGAALSLMVGADAVSFMILASVQGAGVHLQMLDERPEHIGGEVDQSADDDDDADQKA